MNWEAGVQPQPSAIPTLGLQLRGGGFPSATIGSATMLTAVTEHEGAGRCMCNRTCCRCPVTAVVVVVVFVVVVVALMPACRDHDSQPQV